MPQHAGVGFSPGTAFLPLELQAAMQNIQRLGTIYGQSGFLPPEWAGAAGLPALTPNLNYQQLYGRLFNPQTGQLDRNTLQRDVFDVNTELGQGNLNLARMGATGAFYDPSGVVRRYTEGPGGGLDQANQAGQLPLAARDQAVREAELAGFQINPYTLEQTSTPTLNALIARQNAAGYLMDPRTGQQTGQQTLQGELGRGQLGLQTGALTGYYGGQQTLAGELGRGELDLSRRRQEVEEANLAANPRNYALSFFLNRGQQPSFDPNQTPFLRALRGESSLPAFGGSVGDSGASGATVAKAPVGGMMRAQVMPQQQQGGGMMRYGVQPQTQQRPQWNVPQAHQLNQRAFANLDPSERDAFDSMVSASGQDPRDYEARRQRSLPRTRIGNIVSRFTG